MTRAALVSSLILLLSACSTPVEPEPAPLEFDRRHAAVDAYLGIAEHRARKGDLSGALSAADAAVRRVPTSGPAQLARIRYLARGGDPAELAEARGGVEAIAAENPDAPGLPETRATVALASADPEAAWSALQPVLDVDSSPSLHALAAEIQLVRGDETAAIDEADRALAADPANGRALAARAFAHQRLGDDRAAELDARYGLRTRRDDATLRLLLVETQLRLGKPRSAEGSLAQLPAAARNAQAERLAGAIASAQDDSAAAREAYERALALEPDDARALHSLALLDIEEGDPEAALARLADDAKSDGSILRARAYLAADRPNEAVDELRALLRAQPDLIEPWGLLLSASPATGTPEARAAAAWSTDESGTDTVPGALVLAALLTEEDDAAQAARLYDEALSRHPGLAVAANNRASGLLDAGQETERALQLARTAHARSEGAPLIADTLGRALLEAGEAQEALIVVSHGIADADPRSEVANVLRARRALALEALGKDDEAFAAADELLREHRNSVEDVDEADTEARPEPTWLADAQAVHDRLAEPDADAEPEADAESASDAESEADAEPASDAEPEADAEPASDAAPEADADTRETPRGSSEAGADPKSADALPTAGAARDEPRSEAEAPDSSPPGISDE